MKKKVIITGITGTLGSALGELYLKRDWEVYGVTRQPMETHPACSHVVANDQSSVDDALTLLEIEYARISVEHNEFQDVLDHAQEALRLAGRLDDLWLRVRASLQVEYKTPVNLAFTPDGREVFVACESSGTVVVVDAETRHQHLLAARSVPGVHLRPPHSEACCHDPADRPVGPAALRRRGDPHPFVDGAQKKGLRPATRSPGAAQPSRIHARQRFQEIERAHAVPELEAEQADAPQRLTSDLIILSTELPVLPATRCQLHAFHIVDRSLDVAGTVFPLLAGVDQKEVFTCSYSTIPNMALP